MVTAAVGSHPTAITMLSFKSGRI